MNIEKPRKFLLPYLPNPNFTLFIIMIIITIKTRPFFFLSGWQIKYNPSNKIYIYIYILSMEVGFKLVVTVWFVYFFI